MSTVEKVLGINRVEEICKKHGLNAESTKVVREILNRWEKLVGDPIGKMQASMDLSLGNSQRMQIASALMEINLSFATGKIS